MFEKKSSDFLDDNTDKEDNDSEDMTNKRRDRKKNRQVERIRISECQPDISSLPGNVQFITWFNDHLKKTDKSKDTFQKYVKILFLNKGSSWLEFMLNLMGPEFKLIKLIDWRSNNVVLPNYPQEWFDQVPNEPQFGTKK